MSRVARYLRLLDGLKKPDYHHYVDYFDLFRMIVSEIYQGPEAWTDRERRGQSNTAET